MGFSSNFIKPNISGKLTIFVNKYMLFTQGMIDLNADLR